MAEHTRRKVRIQYDFVGRDENGNYVWQSTLPIPGSTKYEEIRVNPDWFWGRR